MKYLVILILAVLMSCNSESNQNVVVANPLPSDTLHFSAVNAQVKGMYPVVISKNLATTKTFYTKWFGYKVIFESSWFMLLASPGENSSMIAFMDEVHPSTPPSPKATSGDGLFLTLDVADSQSLFESLKKAGANFSYALTEEPWGQRRFALTDPNGIWIDVVEQIQPKEGWWDQYMTE